MKYIYEDIENVAKRLEQTVSETDHVIDPIRRSFFRRFPTASILLVTFGAAATIYGIERVLEDIAFLNERPLFIIAIGVATLVVTGRLYKKLG